MSKPETFSNMNDTCLPILTKLKSSDMKPIEVGDSMKLLHCFASCDHKMESKLAGHAGACSKLFNVFDLASVFQLQAGPIAGGPILATYAHLSPSPLPSAVAAFPPGAVIDFDHPPLRIEVLLEQDADIFARLEADRLTKGVSKAVVIYPR